MNNLFNAFSIKVSGQFLDNLKYYQYSDFSVDSLPTDQQTKDKGIAFVRMRQLQRELSKLMIPIYSTISYGTPGTSKLIPTDAEIVVGYMSYDAFVTEKYIDEADKQLKAITTIKAIITDILDSEIIENVEIQKSSTRKQYASGTDTLVVTKNTIEHVTVPAVAPTIDVKYIQIKA